jgi:hypothetical protein
MEDQDSPSKEMRRGRGIDIESTTKYWKNTSLLAQITVTEL